MQVLHLTFQSNSYDIDMVDLDIGDLSTDDEIRRAVANHLSQPVSKFSVLRVERNAETGDITMRPEASFGAVSTEVDQRLAILNSLLTTPHRDLMQSYATHQQLISNDPLFYVRLAAWYFDKGEIRDHKDLFVACLCMSDFEGHRDVGLALLRKLPPFQVMRVVDFISGRYIKKTTKIKSGKKFTYTTATEKFGLFKNLPRSMKTEVSRYLREREADNSWFDGSVLSARKHMKRLYGLFRIKPSDRAQSILFDGKPPTDSKAGDIKALSVITDPSEQAKFIIEKKIPYKIASSVVTAMTPTVMLALIDVMTDQELINNMGSLNARGVFDNADLKAKVESRLEKAKCAKKGKVAALKSIEAVKASGVSTDLARQLEGIADAQLKKKGRITQATAIIVDKSGSMSSAIELGKRLGSAISAVMDAPLSVYAFDSMSYEIKVPNTPEFSEWERAFTGIRASGNTSCGASIDHLRVAKKDVEQIIMITDEGENTSPRFIDALMNYQKHVGHPVRVVFIKVGNERNIHDTLEKQCLAKNIEYDVIDFKGDYYSIPNIIPMLNKQSRHELLLEIMSINLPKRKDS